LLVAVLGTQMLATLIAVYGLFMTPLGWGWALFVWGYALVWFLLNDRVKLIAYCALDWIAARSALNVRSEAALEAKVAPKPDAGPPHLAARLQARR
jgi:H+-transporting ATPase